MANYSDLFSIVDRPATTSVPADKSAQPTVKIHNDEIDSLERLIKFEQQRMETIQKTTIDLLGEGKNLNNDIESLMAERSRAVNDLSIVRAEAREYESAPAYLKKVKEDHAKVVAELSKAEQERKTLLDNVSALTLELDMLQKSHEKAVKDAEDVVVRINAAEYEWRRKYQECADGVQVMQLRQKSLESVRLVLINKVARLREEQDVLRSDLDQRKKLHSEMGDILQEQKKLISELEQQRDGLATLLGAQLRKSKVEA